MAHQTLITAEVKKFLDKHPSGSQDGLKGEAKVACRLFCPFTHAFTWYILEGYEDSDNIVYGYVVNNANPDFSEYGDIDLNELANRTDAELDASDVFWTTWEG